MAKKMVRKRVLFTVLCGALLVSYLAIGIQNIAQSITLDSSNNPYSFNNNGSVSVFDYQPKNAPLPRNKSSENVAVPKVENVPVPVSETNVVEENEIANQIPIISQKDKEYLDYKDIFLSTGGLKTNNICRDTFGLALLKDYNNKIYVIKILGNSNAEKNGVSVGDQVIKINNKKYKAFKKKSTEQIMNMIVNQNSISFVLKSMTGDKKEVSLTKSNVCFPQNIKDEIYTSYWQQLFPEDININEELGVYSSLSYIPFSSRMNYEISKQVSYLQYWKKKERIFENQYKACLVSSDRNDKFHGCVKSDISKNLEEIRHEETIALEKEKMESQERMQRWGVYASVMNSMAIFDHANALRNQHVDVNHSYSGNVNVNHSGSFNVRLDKGYNW